MDKLFDKLGLYDFWGMFVPGFIGIIVYYTIMKYLKNEEINLQALDFNIIICIVYSYLLGIFLYEIGHFLQDHVIYRKRKTITKIFGNSYGEPMDSFLDYTSKYLSFEEKQLYTKLYNKWIIENNINVQNNHRSAKIFFNFCDYYIEQKGKDSKAAKMQSLYGMSRSLFVFFALVSFLLYPYSLILNSNRSIIGLFILCIGCSILFYMRMKRFNTIRLKVVMRTYLVNRNEKDGQK